MQGLLADRGGDFHPVHVFGGARIVKGIERRRPERIGIVKAQKRHEQYKDEAKAGRPTVSSIHGVILVLVVCVLGVQQSIAPSFALYRCYDILCSGKVEMGV